MSRNLSPMLVLHGLSARDKALTARAEYFVRLAKLLAELARFRGCLAHRIVSNGWQDSLILSWWRNGTDLDRWYGHPEHRRMANFAWDRELIVQGGSASLWIEIYRGTGLAIRRGPQWPDGLRTGIAGAASRISAPTRSSGVGLLALGIWPVAKATTSGLRERLQTPGITKTLHYYDRHGRGAVVLSWGDRDAIDQVARELAVSDGGWVDAESIWIETLLQENGGVRTAVDAGSPETKARLMTQRSARLSTLIE